MLRKYSVSLWCSRDIAYGVSNAEIYIKMVLVFIEKGLAASLGMLKNTFDPKTTGLNFFLTTLISFCFKNAIRKTGKGFEMLVVFDSASEMRKLVTNSFYTLKAVQLKVLCQAFG